MQTEASLKRALSLPLLTFYGLGTILGAGIYVLIGEVAAGAGHYTPLAFLLAAVLAGFSAFSYAELSARYPFSAGEAVYAERAFGKRWLAVLTGMMIVLVGVVSTATLVNGFVGYLQVFFQLPPWLIIAMLVMALSGLAVWGISESAWVAAGTTLIEMGGLLLVLWVGWPQAAIGPALLDIVTPELDVLTLTGILAGAFVAFYAFIGFEDIVNVAEEVREPSRTIPKAIMLALVVATVLYMLIALVAVSLLAPSQLAASDAPLALVYEQATGKAPVFISLISLAAVVNGALIQIVMASRVLYGMASQGWIPPQLSAINPATHTPVRSTLVISTAILVLALWLPLLTLAEITSLITLLIFSLVNLSLLRIKWRNELVEGVVSFPFWIPLAGFICSFCFALFQLWRWLAA